MATTGEPHLAALFVQSHAQVRGDQPALTDLTTTLTFGELADRVAAVASVLVEAGGEGPVAVLADRGVDSVLALLGSLWAAKGIVPLDADDPPARLVHVLDRAHVQLVLDATGRFAGDLGPGRTLLRMPAVDAPGVAPQPIDLDMPVVLLFTSGSTGVPKGVPRTVRETLTALRSPSISTQQRVAVFAPVHFAGGLSGVATGVVAGQFTALIDPRLVPPAQARAALLELGIQRVDITPSLARALADSLGDGEVLDGVELMRMIGEGLDWSDAAAILRVLPPDVRILVTYGASELSGVFAEYEIHHGDPIGEGRVPLGRPLPGAQWRLEPVLGADHVAELVVRGMVTAGYWEDPALTAERFGVDDDGVRFWRSGDLVSVDDDGVFHHRGRADDMLKVNGRLVEPAEAERVLAAAPGVRRAVVLPRVLPSGRQQFIAHVEADADASPDAVWAAMRAELPAHLVPAVLERHDRLPTTERGKIDRLLLRSRPVTPWRDTASVVAADPFEASVTALVASILDIDHLTVDDNVWDLGCDSLAAMEIVVALEDAFGVHLDPNVLLNDDTPRRLATRLRSGVEAPAGPVVVHPEGSLPPYVVVAGAGGPAVSYHALAAAFGPDRPVVVYEQRGLHRRGERPDRSVRANASRHLADLRTRMPGGPYVLIGHSWGGLVALEMGRRLQEDGHDVRVVLLDTVYGAGALPGTVRPANLRTRQAPWPVHVAKLARWQLSVQARRLRERLSAPPGSEARYHRFYRAGARTIRGYRPAPLDAPVLLVHPATVTPPSMVEVMPRLVSVAVGGDHQTMVAPPHATDTAAVIAEFAGC